MLERQVTKGIDMYLTRLDFVSDMSTEDIELFFRPMILLS